MLFSRLFSAECGETASPLILEASVAYRLLQGSNANDFISLSRIVIDGLWRENAVRICSATPEEVSGDEREDAW